MIVFTHRLEDRHQDHRFLAELTWNTFRNHTILEYEIPKYEGDLGHPNVFVPLEPAVSQRKIELLMTMFGTQRSKRWFTRGAVHVGHAAARLERGGRASRRAARTPSHARQLLGRV